MFNHIWSVICQNSSIDSQSNTVSLFNCIENIGIDIEKNKSADKINIPIQFDIVSCWTIEDDTKKNDFVVKIEMIKPDGKTAFQKEENIFTEVGWKRVRNIVKLSGLELGINDSGRYMFKISQKEKRGGDFILVASLPIDIKINIK